MRKTTLGVIVGNRGFFPKHLCDTGRAEVLRVLAEEGIGAVALGVEDTPHGSVETLQDAEKCAALFRQHREAIDGVLVTLPNFGDERAVANTLRLSGLSVPVLVQAFPDEAGKMTVNGQAVHDFSQAFYFWLGSAIVAVLLSCALWNVKPKA